MELFTYFRSTAAYRVRIVLNLKGIEHKLVSVNLLKGEDQSDDYLALNPQGLVPCLKLDNGTVLAQSQAIIEYLEATHPEPRLIAEDVVLAAQMRALTAGIACDIHPLNNLRVLKYLESTLGVSPEGKTDWYAYWIQEGFKSLESSISPGPYALGDTVSLVDVFLVPQVFNALRFSVTVTGFPKIMSVYEACNQLSEFIDAAPENQPDAV